MKTCDKCGAFCPDESKFCESCGNRFTVFAQQEPIYPQENNMVQSWGNPTTPAPPLYDQTTPTYYQPPYQNPGVPVPYQQAPVKRSAPMALGIIGIIFAILLPIVTYPCSIIGLVMANQDNRAGAKNTSGLVINIVALVIAAINSILGAMLYSGLF